MFATLPFVAPSSSSSSSFIITFFFVVVQMILLRGRSSEYIDYEKLKLVLKRAKASVEYCDGIIKRMPPGVVAEVRRERNTRTSSEATAALSSSLGEKIIIDKDSKTMTTPMELGYSSVEDSSTPNNNFPTVATPLLSNPRKASWGSNINHTMIKVTSYLGFANDRKLLLQAYDDADEKLEIFEQSYEQEVSDGTAHYFFYWIL